MSPSWSTPAEIAKDSHIFDSMLFAFTGLYLWEILNSLSFDWAVLTGKHSFKWPLIVYFTCRYSILWCLISVILTENVTSEINCQALFTFSQLAGNVALGTASLNLMLRTIAVWERSLPIVIILTVLALGHWGILLHGVITVIAKWMPSTGACQVTSVPPIFLSLLLVYTMILDLFVLALTTYRLTLSGSHSRIMSLLFRDGVIYFVVAFTANTVPVAFALLNWNPVMSIMFNVPAAVASCIAACRAVRHLVEYGSHNIIQSRAQERSTMPQAISTLRARSNPLAHSEGTSGYIRSHVPLPPNLSFLSRSILRSTNTGSSSDNDTPYSLGEEPSTLSQSEKQGQMDLEKGEGIKEGRSALDLSVEEGTQKVGFSAD